MRRNLTELLSAVFRLVKNMTVHSQKQTENSCFICLFGLNCLCEKTNDMEVKITNVVKIHTVYHVYLAITIELVSIESSDEYSYTKNPVNYCPADRLRSKCGGSLIISNDGAGNGA